MNSLFSDIGPEIPFSLLLMALLGLRARVVPRASLWINATAEQVWSLIEIKDGKEENWGRTRTVAELVDVTNQVYRKTYQTELSNGLARAFEAFFSIRKKVQNSELVIDRARLEGKSTNNELLRQTYRLLPEHGGTRLIMSYEWGPRPLVAQLTARADLWGGLYRLKGVAENGIPNERPYQLISAGVALVTGLLTFAGFAYLLTWQAGLMVIFALFVHELGHLLAYRMIGQPWGRLIFLPFLGAIAMPRLPFETQGQAVFAALMGPGLSSILAIGCALWGMAVTPPNVTVVLLGLFTVAINFFNLLPAEPLDGGIAMRSVLQRVIGNRARIGLMAAGLMIISAGLLWGQILMVIFGAIAMVLNIKDRPIDVGLKPLSQLQVAISFFAYVTMTTAYATLLQAFLVQLANSPELTAGLQTHLS